MKPRLYERLYSRLSAIEILYRMTPRAKRLLRYLRKRRAR